MVSRATGLLLLVTGVRAFALSPTGLQERLDSTPKGGSIRLPAGEHGGGAVRRGMKVSGEGPETRLGPVKIDAPHVEMNALFVAGLVIGSGASVEAVDVVLGGTRPLVVEAGGELRLRGGRITCEGEMGTGAVIAGRLVLEDTVVASGCHRGLDVVARGLLELEGAEVSGRVAAVRVVEGTLKARRSRVTAAAKGEGVGLFSARSSVEGQGLVLQGGEQGFLARGGSVVLDDVAVSGSAASALALIEVRAPRLTTLRLVGPFSHGAVLLTESPEARLADVDVKEAGSAGVLFVRSQGTLERIAVAGARSDGNGDFGHGVALEESSAVLSGVRVDGAQGAAVYASNATVRVRGLLAHDAGAGIAATHRSTVQVRGAQVGRAQVGVAAWQDSKVALAEAEVGGALGIVSCGGGAVTQGAGVVVGGPLVRCDPEQVEQENAWRPATP